MSRLDVIYEDTDLLVVNKPAGVIVNNSDTTAHVITLQEMVQDYLHIPKNPIRLITQRKEGEWERTNEVRSLPAHEVSTGGAGLLKEQRLPEQWNPNWEPPEDAFANRAGIVHRLDKETSGVMLVAKTLDSFIELQKQFKERVIEKNYIALAHGKILPAKGEINVPVGRLEFNRKRFGVVAGGRESVTHYEVERYLESPKTKEILSFVRLFPKTGRTHQIRVHLQYIGHPIFGDELYAGRKVSREDRRVLPRVFLHAAHISFTHPINGKKMDFEAPLPNELSEVLKSFEEK